MEDFLKQIKFPFFLASFGCYIMSSLLFLHLVEPLVEIIDRVVKRQHDQLGKPLTADVACVKEPGLECRINRGKLYGVALLLADPPSSNSTTRQNPHVN